MLFVQFMHTNNTFHSVRTRKDLVKVKTKIKKNKQQDYSCTYASTLLSAYAIEGWGSGAKALVSWFLLGVFGFGVLFSWSPGCGRDWLPPPVSAVLASHAAARPPAARQTAINCKHLRTSWNLHSLLGSLLLLPHAVFLWFLSLTANSLVSLLTV